MVTSSIMMKQPLIHTIGNSACLGFSTNLMAHNYILILGGAGMAFYRLISYKMAHKMSIKDLQKLKNQVLWIELLIGALLVGLSAWAVSHTNFSGPLEFCRGYTREMTTIISEYQGGQSISFGIKIFYIIFGLSQLIILFEFLCYAIIMISLYLHDRKLSKDKVIDSKVMKSRTKKNAITMTGQLLSFLMGLGYTLLLFILYKLERGWGIFQYGNMVILIILLWTANTVTQIWTSPEMRRFLARAKVDVVQNNAAFPQLFKKVGSVRPSHDLEMKTL